IHTLITEVSYPSSFAKLAYDSKHLTPALLKEELIQSKRRNFTLYVMHLKALFQETIIKELNTLHLLRNGGKVLVDGDRINYTQL
ncbi:MAG: hypothetical protein IE879_03700, partial [Sulfuricurvum sp.]|nr:hypothetical protein [Sulfuricurvum sp.]